MPADIDGRPHGGFSDAALHLTLASERMVSRQLVHRWWMKRHINGFPEPAHVTADGRALFDLQKIEAWYASYVPAKGGRPRKNKEGNHHVA
jgi:hypothetical protein